MYRSGTPTPRERFLDQFESDGGDWLYRHREIGAAYRVTDAEKNAFVARFERGRRGFVWPAIIVYILVGGWLVIPPMLRDDIKEVPFSWIWLLWMFVAGCQWLDERIALGVPLKQLRHRAPVAPALSKEDRRRLALERLPLTVLVGTATITFVLLLYFAVERPPIGPINLILIVASIAALAWAIVQGIRKWHVNRSDYAASTLI